MSNVPPEQEWADDCFVDTVNKTYWINKWFVRQSHASVLYSVRCVSEPTSQRSALSKLTIFGFGWWIIRVQNYNYAVTTLNCGHLGLVLKLFVCCACRTINININIAKCNCGHRMLFFKISLQDVFSNHFSADIWRLDLGVTNIIRQLSIIITWELRCFLILFRMKRCRILYYANPSHFFWNDFANSYTF